MTKRTMFAIAALTIFSAATAFAQCKEAAQAKAGCDKAKAACDEKKAACSDHGKHGEKDECGDVNCAGDQVRYKDMPIPRMIYQVGDQRLTCPKSSVKLAKDTNTEIKYVVTGKVYDNKDKALDAHCQQLEKAYDNMLNINYCVDGKTTDCRQTAEAMAKKADKPVCFGVGSFCFADKESAEKAAKAAREAGDQVQMAVMVGDKSYEYPHKATGVAKAEGKQVKYCVGKMNTTSETMAKIQLTVERIKTALDEVEKAGGKQIAST